MTDSAGTPDSNTRTLGPDSGRVLVKTGREGLAARAGHDLTLEITDWQAEVTVPGAPAQTEIAATLNLGSLTVREGTGGAKPLSDKDRRDIQNQARKILGNPATASFTSTAVIPSAGAAANQPTSGVIEGTLALHGASRAIRLEVSSPEPARYRGTTTIRQSDYGITPYSGFFGALKLRDEVTVEFEVSTAGIQTGKG
jgi:polyisoprenoid-binding protein YceI